MACIFCGTNYQLTDEHVFPAFFGSHLVVKDGTCNRCNATCNEFENRIANQTANLRNVLQIVDRYGDVPHAKAEVEVQYDGSTRVTTLLRRTAEGEILLHDFVKQVHAQDGKKIHEGFFVSEENAKKFIDARTAKGERVTDLGAPKDVTLLANTQQTIGFAFSTEMRRLAAKVALASFAFLYGTEYASQPNFDDLRQSILTGRNLTAQIFANEDFANLYLRWPRHHDVQGYLSAGMKRGWATVTFFGGLSYVVEVTGMFAERDSRNFHIFYDTETRVIFEPLVLHDEQEVIGRVLSPRTAFDDIAATDAQWYAVMERYCQAQGLVLSRIPPLNS
jgi:hypothetical protein